MIFAEQAPTPVREHRVRLEQTADYTLCFLDFRDLRDADATLAAIAEAKQGIASQPLLSVRVLTDIAGSLISQPVIAALQDLARCNAPYVTKSAVVGASLSQRAALRQIRRLTGRDIREFSTAEDALAYLRA